MSASIFSFSRPRSSSADRPRPSDWTTQELAELYRVCDRLVEAGLRVSLCRGLSDEGEPWAVFERDESAEVIVHIARIDGVLVVVNNATNQVYKGVDFRTVTEQMLVDAPLAMPRRLEDPKVVYHPRAVFTAFVAAAIVVTEMARNVEKAEAGEATDGADAALSGSSVLAQLVARFLSRDGNQPLQALAAGSGVFGIIGAAALAVDMMPYDADGSAALAAAGEVASTPTQRIDPALSAAISDRSARSEAGGVDQTQMGLPEARTSHQASSDRASLSARESEIAASSHSAGGPAAPVLLTQQESGLPGASQPEDHPFGPAVFASAERGAGMPLSTPAPAEAAQDVVRPTVSERHKIADALFVDFGRKGDDGGAILIASSARSQEKSTAKESQDTLSFALSDGSSAVISHVTSDGGIYILDTNAIEHVLYTGGDAIIHNFRFGQDQIQIGHMESSGDWFQDLYIIGNDVRIVGVDGGSITLYDSFHSLA